MKEKDHCDYCGAPLGNEKYWLPISIDEEYILCYDCNLEENAGILVKEVEEDEELMELIREWQSEHDREEKFKDDNTR